MFPGFRISAGQGNFVTRLLSRQSSVACSRWATHADVLLGPSTLCRAAQGCLDETPVGHAVVAGTGPLPLLNSVLAAYSSPGKPKPAMQPAGRGASFEMCHPCATPAMLYFSRQTWQQGTEQTSLPATLGDAYFLVATCPHISSSRSPVCLPGHLV